jgi:hypothetical protein
MPPATPPLPSTPPPPPPEREVNAVNAAGMVTGPRGNPVPYAHVIVEPANASCQPAGVAIGAVADGNGEFSATVEGAVGPAYHGCIRVTAESGGGRGTVTLPAYYTSSKNEQITARADVRLSPPPRLTAAEAERLVQELAAAINDPGRAAAVDLTQYVNGGGEALRVAADQYRQILGGVVSVREVAPEEWYRVGLQHTFDLRGSSGRTARVVVHQESLTQLTSLVLDYGIRTRSFMMAFVRAISSGDAERLARLLNPDDVEFPVEKAREMVIRYRQRFDTGTLRPEFVSVDEARGTFTYRVRGRTPSGTEAEELIELQTGDGLIGVVGLDRGTA